jgi:HEAT repeat protein
MGVLGDPAPRRAIPILLTWLPRLSEPEVKADVARVLADLGPPPEAYEMLRDEFRRVASADVGDGACASCELARALLKASGRSHRAELLELALDQRYGLGRSDLIRRLARSRDPKLGKAMIALLRDPLDQIRLDALKAVSALAPREAEPHLGTLLTDPDPDVAALARRIRARMSSPSGPAAPPCKARRGMDACRAGG